MRIAALAAALLVPSACTIPLGNIGGNGQPGVTAAQDPDWDTAWDNDWDTGDTDVDVDSDVDSDTDVDVDVDVDVDADTDVDTDTDTDADSDTDADTDPACTSADLVVHQAVRNSVGTCSTCPVGLDLWATVTVDNPCDTDVVIRSTQTCLATGWSLLDPTTSAILADEYYACGDAETDFLFPVGTTALDDLPLGAPAPHDYQLQVLMEGGLTPTGGAFTVQ